MPLNRIALRVCALVVGTAALAVPPALAAPVFAAGSGCVGTSQPLGAATGYTEFIKGSGSRGSESEGAIAWGGDLAANSMTVGTRLNAAASDPTLVVAGTHGSFNLQQGSAYVAPQSNVNFNGGGSYLASDPIDFTGAFSTLATRSTAWGTAAANGTTSTGTVGGNPNYLILTGTDATANIFSLTPAQLSAAAGIAYNVPAGATTLINVSGSAVTLQGQMWVNQGGSYNQVSDGTDSATQNILWNFPSATSITMNVGSAWAGSILAPKATLNVSNVGHTIGQIITAGFNSNFETHQNLFPSSACLPPLTAPTHPSIKLVKSASAIADLDNNGTDAGDTITYSFAVTNTGDVALTALALNDPLLGGAISCPAGSLAAGAATTCTSTSYTISAADMAAGSVTNSATVSGTAPDSTVVTGTSSVSTTLTPTTPPPPSTANVKITKAVDNDHPRPGDTVTYTVTASNAGPAAAQNVSVSDALPSGITFVSASSPCTYAGGTITCSLGTIASGGSQAVTIKATVNPVPTGEAAVQHEITVEKQEVSFGLGADETQTVSVACQQGYLVLDGSPLVQAVDQGTGTVADVAVTKSYASDASTWTTTLTNNATGRAQGQVFAVCVQASTSVADGHSHLLVVSAPTSSQATAAGTTTLTCATGQVPVTPGYQLGSGAVTASYPSGTTGWTFVATGPGTFSIACLDDEVGEADGHQHELSLTPITETVTVQPGASLEAPLVCADDAKGIVAGWNPSAGLVVAGNEPQPKTRLFSLVNPTSSPLTVNLSLLCLGTKTVGGAAVDTVVNTASVSTTTTESSTADNTASASFTVDTTPASVASPSVAVASPSIVVAGSRVSAIVTCSSGRTTCAGTATLVAARTQRIAGHTVRKGTVLAKASYRVASGHRAVVHLKATKAGRRVLHGKRLKKARLRIGGQAQLVAVRR
ncbi:MAG TPA: collagen-binding domain-containing protein [Marmoricola sp.]|nr:collagen-binding domain-containing protein [Marmoricola sp.]